MPKAAPTTPQDPAAVDPVAALLEGAKTKTKADRGPSGVKIDPTLLGAFVAYFTANVAALIGTAVTFPGCVAKTSAKAGSDGNGYRVALIRALDAAGFDWPSLPEGDTDWQKIGTVVSGGIEELADGTFEWSLGIGASRSNAKTFNRTQAALIAAATTGDASDTNKEQPAAA